LNNLRGGTFLYEVYGFYNLFYGQHSFIKNLTEATDRLDLSVDITSDRTYPGPNMNYLPGQAKSSNYVLSQSLYSAALFAKTLRKVAYASYMSTQTAMFGTDYAGYTIEIDYTDIDYYTEQICTFQPEKVNGQVP